MKKTLKTLFILSVVTFAAMNAQAQVSVNVDVMNRYVWRGTDFGNSPSIQPGISYTSGGLEVGGWAAFATNGNPAGSEIDWYASYTLGLGDGSLSIGLTDYTFPDTPTGNYFSGDSHFIELGLGYSGPESFPISLSGGVFLTNDDDYSTYLELGYTLSAIDVFVGFTPTESALYGTEGAGLINTGISTGKEIQVSDTFSFTLTSAAILNFHDENAFFLVGFSL
ncbi:MAG: TorF family putative porin [Balneolales bacterium]